MRVLVLCGRALRFSLGAIKEEIALSASCADPVLLVETNIEPDRTVEGTILIEAKPGQLLTKSFGRLRVREITVPQTPVRDRTRHAMYQLPDRTLSSAVTGIGAVGNVSVKIF